MFPAKLPTMKNNKIVMVCIDGSEHSERAFNWYINNIHHQGDEVGLIHVHVQPSVGLFAGGFAAMEGYMSDVERSIAKSKEVVNKYFDICKEKGISVKIHVHTKDNSIGHTIIQIAKEHHAALIIIGSRGIGTIRRTFLGSVSDYVLKHSHIATTVIPPVEGHRHHHHFHLHHHHKQEKQGEEKL